jgi:hypothetical protein
VRNGHRYYLLSEDTWQASERVANELGGHLVTVNDLDEQRLIFDTFGGWGGVDRSLWIGLRRVGVEGEFRWTSGETVGFTHWLPSQPDNSPSSGGEGFVHMINSGNEYGHKGGLWNDIASPNLVFPTFDPICGVVEVIPEQAPILSIRYSNQSGMEVCWTATPGKSFDLQRCSDLANPIWEAVAIVTGTDGEGCLSIVGASNANGFYRLRSRAP